MRTAQSGRITISDSGSRMVSDAAKKEFINLGLNTNIMLITHSMGVSKISGRFPGLQLNFSIITAKGDKHRSNLFLGTKNKLASKHARILGCSIQELKNTEVLEKKLNKLVGRCVRFSTHGQWIRPIQDSKVIRLDHLIASV